MSGAADFVDIAALTDENGSFALTASTAGEYTLECAAEGYATGRVRVTLTAGLDTQVAISLH